MRTFSAKNKVMKKIFFCVVCVFVCATVKNNGCHFQPVSAVQIKEPQTIEEKYTAIQKFAVHLEQENKIGIPADKFAKILLVVLYSESGLKTNCLQGIFQITRGMKKSLGIPHNIWDYGFNEQLFFLETYLDASKHLKKIHNTNDLHIILACPMKFGKTEFCCASNKGLKALDFNKNQKIDIEDFTMFDKHRAKENTFIKKIYDEIS